MAIFTTVRIICLVIASSMLTYTTSPTMLTDAMERLFSPLKVIKRSLNSYDDDDSLKIYTNSY